MKLGIRNLRTMQSALTAALVVWILWIPVVHAQDGNAALEDALESYGRQDYGKITDIFGRSSPDLLVDRSQRFLAYDLFAQALFYTDQNDSLRVVINRLLDLQADYTTGSPAYPPEFVAIVNEVRENRESEQATSLWERPWVWIGGVAVSAAAVLLIINKDEPQKQNLPEAPDPPNLN